MRSTISGGSSLVLGLPEGTLAAVSRIAYHVTLGLLILWSLWRLSTFYFPSDEGHPVLVGGISAAVFRDAPEVWQVMEYLGSAEFADARQAAQSERVGGGLSGFLTGNMEADVTGWAELEQGFIEQLQTADPAAFDGSDQMPAEVGSGTFWTEGTSFVNGDQDAEAATENIQNSWPS